MANERDQPLCPACLTALGITDHFCAKCGAPLTFASTVAPVPSVRAEGEFYRRLATRPKLAHVVVAWLIFSPALVFAVAIKLGKVDHPFLVTVVVALLVVCLLVPLTVTKRYLAGRVRNVQPNSG